MAKKSEKIKIGYVIQRFHPFKGGAESNMFAFASRAAKSDKFDVTVLTANIKFRDELPPYRETVDGMKIIRNWAINEELYMGFYPMLLPSLLSNKFDVIHTSGIGFIWREMCLCIKKLVSPSTKFVCTPHGPFMALNDSEGFRGMAKKYYTMVLRVILPWLYDYVIAVNEEQHNWMTSEYKIPQDKIIVFPNGIDKSYIESKIYQPKIDGKVVISFLGRFARYKGVQYVIEALGEIKKKNKNIPEFEFWALGRQTEHTEYLKKLVTKFNLEKEVSFIFSPSDEERDDALYKHSQINILPSQWEASGIALMEAMAKGNVILSSKQNEISSTLIKEGVNGYTFDYWDIDKLVEILKIVLKDKDLRLSMIEENLKLVKNYTWESIYPKYEDFIMQLFSSQ